MSKKILDFASPPIPSLALCPFFLKPLCARQRRDLYLFREEKRATMLSSLPFPFPLLLLPHPAPGVSAASHQTTRRKRPIQELKSNLLTHLACDVCVAVCLPSEEHSFGPS